MARKKAKKKHDNGDDEYIPKSNIRKRKVYTRPSESEPPSPNLDVSGTSGGVHEEEEQGQESPGPAQVPRTPPLEQSASPAPSLQSRGSEAPMTPRGAPGNAANMQAATRETAWGAPHTPALVAHGLFGSFIVVVAFGLIVAFIIPKVIELSRDRTHNYTNYVVPNLPIAEGTAPAPQNLDRVDIDEQRRQWTTRMRQLGGYNMDWEVYADGHVVPDIRQGNSQSGSEARAVFGRDSYNGEDDDAE